MRPQFDPTRVVVTVAVLVTKSPAISDPSIIDTNPTSVLRRAWERITALLDPLIGGPSGQGYPYRRPSRARTSRPPCRGVDGLDTSQPVRVCHRGDDRSCASGRRKRGPDDGRPALGSRSGLSMARVAIAPGRDFRAWHAGRCPDQIGKNADGCEGRWNVSLMKIPKYLRLLPAVPASRRRGRHAVVRRALPDDRGGHNLSRGTGATPVCNKGWRRSWMRYPRSSLAPIVSVP